MAMRSMGVFTARRLWVALPTVLVHQMHRLSQPQPGSEIIGDDLLLMRTRLDKVELPPLATLSQWVVFSLERVTLLHVIQHPRDDVARTLRNSQLAHYV